jgi:hypothetical protein
MNAFLKNAVKSTRRKRVSTARNALKNRAPDYGTVIQFMVNNCKRGNALKRSLFYFGIKAISNFSFKLEMLA